MKVNEIIRPTQIDIENDQNNYENDSKMKAIIPPECKSFICQ